MARRQGHQEHSFVFERVVPLRRGRGAHGPLPNHAPPGMEFPLQRQDEPDVRTPVRPVDSGCNQETDGRSLEVETGRHAGNHTPAWRERSQAVAT